MPHRFGRRALLRSLAALPLAPAALLASPARAIGERSKVSIGKVRHRGNWNTRPEALRRLLWEVGKRTSIHVARDAVQVTPMGEELFFQPLLSLAGEGELSRFSDEERARLSRHLRFGGMIWADAPSPSDPFFESAKAELEEVLGEQIAPLESEHVLFKSYYLLKRAYGRTDEDTRVFGGLLGDRAAVLMTSCDVLGAYERDRLGTWRFECIPDGERQRERAFRFGVNVLMYATCLDYKADQVHIPFIMKKRRR